MEPFETMACDVIKFYYKDALDANIEEPHNSDQWDKAIAEDIKRLVDDLLFLQGPCNIEVSPYTSFF